MKLGAYELDNIYSGDALELGRGIPDKAVDLIFTDPPYLREFIPLYFWLFELAARILKPTGFLLTYAGGYWKDELMARSREHLDYFWDFSISESGDSPILWPRRIIASGKSILCYRPRGGSGMPQTNVLAFFKTNIKDKRFHGWGQDENTARYYLQCFSAPGEIVLDPFCGGGTVPMVAHLNDRRYLSFDVDAEAVISARRRIADENYRLFGKDQQKTLWRTQA